MLYLRALPAHLLLSIGLAVASAGALAAGLPACAAGPTFVVQSYAGPVRQKDTIATLRVNGRDNVRLATLDREDIGAPIESDSRLHIELLPGRHALTVQTTDAPALASDPIGFEAQPGRVYRVAMISGAPRVFEVDRGADTQVRDVTQTFTRSED